MMKDYIFFLPIESRSLIQKWIAEIDVVIKVVKARKTKLGDFRYSYDNKYIITTIIDIIKIVFIFNFLL